MSDPYFNSQELDFLKSLALPQVGFLLQINSGAGGALAQFHEIRPKLSLEGVESSWDLRQAFSRNTGHSFSACVWAEEYHEDEESYDVIYFSGMAVDEVTDINLFERHFDRYWTLLTEGGFLLIEIVFADEPKESQLDWKGSKVDWLEEVLRKIHRGRMKIGWFPVASKHRGILSLSKSGQD